MAPKLPDELTETKAGAVLDKVVTGASAVLAGTGMLTMAEETRPMAGGLILRDDKVETNCSFEVLIHLQKEDLAAEVARALFEYGHTPDGKGGRQVAKKRSEYDYLKSPRASRMENGC